MKTDEIIEKLNLYSEIQAYIRLNYIEKFGSQAWYNLLDCNQGLEGITIIKIAINNLARF